MPVAACAVYSVGYICNGQAARSAQFNINVSNDNQLRARVGWWVRDGDLVSIINHQHRLGQLGAGRGKLGQVRAGWDMLGHVKEFNNLWAPMWQLVRFICGK